MSRIYTANQFEDTYKASRLCNWEVPAPEKARSRSPEPRPKGARTEFIANDRGWLNRGVHKGASGIDTPFQGTISYRWPSHNSQAISPYSGAATMGYKGIQTDYLPTSTVYPKLIPGTREHNYR